MREITVYFYSIENDVGESKTITNVGEERSDGLGAMTLNRENRKLCSIQTDELTL